MVLRHAVILWLLRGTAVAQINVYWGQNGATRLADVCSSGLVDYITLAFVNVSPENGGGYPGTNFLDCPVATYSVDGKPTKLLQDCVNIADDMISCRSSQTKILLSIGGVLSAKSNYTVSTVANGEAFADFLWGAFGPYDSSWTGPRPFDTSEAHNSVDGFDFDIEHKFPDQKPWVAMIGRLRSRFGDKATSRFLISGAPQCPLDDKYAQMKDIISQAHFDLLSVQFYNNPSCDGLNGGFNFDAWVNFLQGTQSKKALVSIGLPASADAAGSGYLDQSQMQSLVDKYSSHSTFGGVMLWDSWFATDNGHASNTSYLRSVKAVLGSTSSSSSPASPSSSSPSSSFFSLSVAATTTQSSGVPVTTSTSCASPYVVQAGDTCDQIASSHGLSIDQLRNYNPNLNASCDVKSGQSLCLNAS